MNTALASKASKPEILYDTERVTPAEAEQWLAANRFNRPMSRNIVAEYVDAMRAGEWLVNGEAIKFDWNGRLVDGQHRLAAVVKAAVPIWFSVTRNLDPEVFKTLDTGKKRSSGDVLAIAGVTYPTEIGIACRQLFRHVNQEMGRKRRITNTQLDDMRKAHPRLLPLCDEAAHSPYHIASLPLGQAMYAFYAAVHVDERRARSFFRTLAGKPEQGAPIEFAAVQLRERYTKVMEEIIKPPPKVRLAWLIDAFSAAVGGRKAERFSRIITELPEWEPAPKFPRSPSA